MKPLLLLFALCLFMLLAAACSTPVDCPPEDPITALVEGEHLQAPKATQWVRFRIDRILDDSSAELVPGDTLRIGQPAALLFEDSATVWIERRHGAWYLKEVL